MREYADGLAAAREIQEEHSQILSELVNDLERAKDRAEDATRARSEYLGMVEISADNLLRVRL